VALLWERRVEGTLYQVRSAGRTRRLYTNGVFHSQYNPVRPVTGSVWDLLLLPAFFYAPGELRRVLVLGVGGGAVIRQLCRFIRPEAIVGVELNAVHLSIARRFFGVGGAGVVLEQADAADWVRRYRGPGFDMIVDDLFGDYAGEPQRAVFADADWVGSLSRCLNPGGVIVSNFTSPLELEVSAFLGDAACRRRFRSAFSLSTSRNYNAVGVFLDKPADTRELRERLKRIPLLDPRKSRGVRYHIRTLAL
jgi:predicted membrane-bound spermidine synthase